MKQVLFWIPAFCAVALSLSNCANNNTPGGGDPTASYGPFDEHGKYREDWADDPSKWRKVGGKKPQIAKNDDVPLNSVPLAPGKSSAGNSKPLTLTPLPPTKTPGPVVVKSTPKKPTVKEATEETPKTKPTLVKVKPRPEPEPEPKKVTKSKPKPKPKAERYTVKKGDTLSGIASKTGSSVSGIKGANGISGSMIHPGQTLTIPRR